MTDWIVALTGDLGSPGAGLLVALAVVVVRRVRESCAAGHRVGA